MKRNVKVVIGSNYGDECKGLATKYLCEKSNNNDSTVTLNVLFNGGCQRGHTVDLVDGNRHVFHHFGSGTFSNAYTYFDDAFLLNPMIFVQEYENLFVSHNVHPVCFVSPLCKVTTPYDIFINHIIEMFRGDKKHGSCGYGIWETEMRYHNSKYNLLYPDLCKLSNQDMDDYLESIANEYLPKRLNAYGCYDIPIEYQDLCKSKSLRQHYIDDFRKMQLLLKKPIELFELVNTYDDCANIVFEGSQGLELDEDNIKAYPYVTASSTTSNRPLTIIKNWDCDIEICYVTRSYFTRHGAGSFPTECDKEDICQNIEDKTNVYNDYQNNIRYGKFDITEFASRVNRDMNFARNMRDDVKFSIFISHLNYTNNEICGNCTINDLAKMVDKVYLSNSKYSNDVIVRNALTSVIESTS